VRWCQLVAGHTGADEGVEWRGECADAHGATFEVLMRSCTVMQTEHTEMQAAARVKACNPHGSAVTARGDVVNWGQASSWRRSLGAAVRGRRMV
jgi:hypothetical protein